MKPIGTQTITTARLCLRPPQLSDVEELVRMKSLPLPLAQARNRVNAMVAEKDKPFTFHWIITLMGKPIGRIKGWDVNPYNGYLQLGYDIGPEYRNRGYMTEAIQAVLRYMLTVAEANRVFCSVREGNFASRRVCEKCGMRLEGTLRQHYARQDGGFDDVRIYGIVKGDMISR